MEIQVLRADLCDSAPGEEKPLKILEENWKRLRNRAIKYCKVQWKHHSEREVTWEKEDDLREAYPELFRYSEP